MKAYTIKLTDADNIIYESQIRPYLPRNVFDAHCHLFMNRYHPRMKDTMPLACAPMLGDIDLPRMQAWWRALFPDSDVRGMIMGFPTIDVDLEGENAFVAESAGEAGLPFALMVRPEMDCGVLEAAIQRLKPRVLKPYLNFVTHTDPATADITDLIPEAQIALADQYGLAIMLHVSKFRGMADPDNLRAISWLIRAYPNAQFILAHCGRCFIAPNMEAALDELPRAQNLWLDTSAVCDLGVFMALLTRYDRSKIMFGTDLVTAAGFRGSYASLGMGWCLLTSEMAMLPRGMADRSTYAAYENLAALCQAVRYCGLDEEERQALFHDNAVRLYETPVAAGAK